MRRFMYIIPVLLSFTGCVGPSADRVPDRAPAPAHDNVAADNVATDSNDTTTAAPETWASRLSVDHPLVGKIWSVQEARFVDRASLEQRVSRARFVLLGEQHDNADHHRLQAAMIRAVAVAGRKPAVVFEMIDRSRQDQVDAQLAAAPEDVDGFGQAIAWAESGWPAWQIYRPVFEATMSLGLRIIAANLPRDEAMGIARGDALPPEFVAKHKLDTPLPEPLHSALLAQLDASHCGHMPKSMTQPMVAVQRARDAIMADKLVSEAGEHGAVLVAGGGHVRRDRGVPWYMGQPAETVVTIGFAEVADDVTEPAGYASHWDGSIPFDYLWFTPRDNDTDHCKELEERMKKMKGAHAPAGDAPGK